MLSFIERVSGCTELRHQIDALISEPDYAVEQLSPLALQFQELLTQPVDDTVAPEEYAAFLQQNLDWLMALMAKLSADKDTVAAEMLNVNKGKKAKHSYGQ
ncbi:hypothetical protein QE250_14115 [Chromatiaceae bacterium AAb-1]|nr:hypothetical protein [Chromatiaceae bacterium AAb-1]